MRYGVLSDIHANLPGRQTSSFQQQALPLEDVLVEDDQA